MLPRFWHWWRHRYLLFVESYTKVLGNSVAMASVRLAPGFESWSGTLFSLCYLVVVSNHTIRWPYKFAKKRIFFGLPGRQCHSTGEGWTYKWVCILRLIGENIYGQTCNSHGRNEMCEWVTWIASLHYCCIFHVIDWFADILLALCWPLRFHLCLHIHFAYKWIIKMIGTATAHHISLYRSSLVGWMDGRIDPST